MNAGAGGLLIGSVGWGMKSGNTVGLLSGTAVGCGSGTAYCGSGTASVGTTGGCTGSGVLLP